MGEEEGIFEEVEDCVEKYEEKYTEMKILQEDYK